MGAGGDGSSPHKFPLGNNHTGSPSRRNVTMPLSRLRRLSSPMSDFCDVALSVPLDTAFTYRIPEGMQPVVGGRVLVPFRQQRMSGVVVALHDRAPKVQAKNIFSVLDTTPVLDPQLVKLATWIANYYLAPLGEVFRTMLPLGAEFKRVISYRMADVGHMALHLASTSGSSARSRKTPADQAAELRVLEYLMEREGVREPSLRTATRVSKAILAGMVRKKWIAREDVSDVRDAARVVKIAALLKSAEGKLNANQQSLVDTLAAAGGKLAVETLQALDVPRSTLATLVKRGLIEITEEPAEFAMSGMKARPSPLNFQFNAAQQDALQRIQDSANAREFSGLLLHGVTGSGKTAVYLAAMRSVLEAGRSAILLVPEIGLTPAVAADLHQVFGEEVAILHSALSDQERAEQWHRIKRGEARMVVGTRSAVFAPVADLALMIVDEEQDASYKQEETPRYHARDVAVMRAKMANAVVVLGSATPSLESYFNAKKHKYVLLELPDRVEQRPLPKVEIVDMRLEFQETGREQVISRKLAEEISQRLQRKEQVMVLLNRRGYSPVALCRACGKTMECRNCAIAMTHHKQSHRMVCHYCGFMAPVPKVCGECGSEYVYFLGTGSEKLEELLHGMFPQARIARLDRDTVKGRDDFERALNALNAGEDGSVGWHPDDRQRPRHSRGNAGRGGGRRFRFGVSGFSGGGTYISVADPGCGPRRSRAKLRAPSCCKLIFRTTMQCSTRHGTTSPDSTRKNCAFAVGCTIRRTARSPMSWCAAKSWTPSAAMVRRTGKMVRENAARRHSRLRPGRRTDRPRLKLGLSLSFCAEGGQPREIECAAEIDARLCRTREDSAHPGHRGCGRDLVDVSLKNQWHLAVSS